MLCAKILSLQALSFPNLRCDPDVASGKGLSTSVRASRPPHPCSGLGLCILPGGGLSHHSSCILHTPKTASSCDTWGRFQP